MEKVRLGIIGIGNMGSSHAKNIIEGKTPDIELTAVADRKEDRRKWAKETLPESVKIFTEGTELMDSKVCDAVIVAVPHYQHPELAIRAFGRHLHVMCEKPMAINTEEAQKMLDAAKRTGKKLTIGYQNRYRPDSWYLKRACDNGDLGEIYYAKAHAIRRRAVPTWGVFLNEEEQGGGPLIDIGTHALDLTLWTMNNYEPKMVVGSVYKKLGDQRESGNAWGDWDPEEFTVEDSAFGYIVMKDGATIVLESSWALNSLDVDEAKTSLCGTKAGADMKGGLRINKVQYGKQVVENVNLEAGGVAFFDGGAANPEDIEARMWIDAVKNDTDVVVKPEQAIVVTKILEAIYQSAREGKPVFFD